MALGTIGHRGVGLLEETEMTWEPGALRGVAALEG
jgi:hypothetical protein